MSHLEARTPDEDWTSSSPAASIKTIHAGPLPVPFALDFPDEDICLGAILKVVLKRHGACPECNSTTARFYRLRDRKAYICQLCAFKIHPCANTILHGTKISLTTWLRAFYLMSITGDSVPTERLSVQLNVTYKCAWRMRNKLRRVKGHRFFNASQNTADLDRDSLLQEFVEAVMPAHAG